MFADLFKLHLILLTYFSKIIIYDRILLIGKTLHLALKIKKNFYLTYKEIENLKFIKGIIRSHLTLCSVLVGDGRAVRRLS